MNVKHVTRDSGASNFYQVGEFYFPTTYSSRISPTTKNLLEKIFTKFSKNELDLSRDQLQALSLIARGATSVFYGQNGWKVTEVDKLADIYLAQYKD